MSFRIKISDVRCWDLCAEDEKECVDWDCDPYVEFLWPSLKVIRIPYKKKNKNPDFGDWSKTFFYSTRYVDQLAKKPLTIHVKDHNRWTSDTYIGSAKISLSTIVTGPERQRIQLIRDRDDFKSGYITFRVEAEQLCRNMQILFSDVRIPLWSDPRQKGATVYVRACLDDGTKGNAIVLPSKPAKFAPVWPRPPALRLDTGVDSLIHNNLKFTVVLKLANGEESNLLSSAVSFLDIATRAKEGKHVKIVLRMGNGQALGTLEFLARVKNGPQFCQMDDPEALNCSSGIYSTKAVNPYFPTPGVIIKRRPPAVDGVADCRTVSEEEKGRLMSLESDAGLLAGEVADEALFEPIARFGTEYDELVPLPKHWSFAEFPEAKKYLRFRYRPTKQVTCQDPRGLPRGWSQCLDSKGGLYWYQSATGGTTKTDPRGMPRYWSLVMMKKGTRHVRRFVYQHMIPVKTDPRGLPEPWVQLSTQDGRVYFSDQKNAFTTWEDPRRLFDASMLAVLRQNEINAYMTEYWSQVKTRVSLMRAQVEKESKQKMEEAQLLLDNEAKLLSLDQGLADWLSERNQEWTKEASDFDAKQDGPEAEINALARELEAKQRVELQREMDEWRRRMEEAKMKLIAKQKAAVEKLLQGKGKSKERVVKARLKWEQKFFNKKKSAIDDKTAEIRKRKVAVQKAFDEEQQRRAEAKAKAQAGGASAPVQVVEGIVMSGDPTVRSSSGDSVVIVDAVTPVDQMEGSFVVVGNADESSQPESKEAKKRARI